jgi:DNA-binding response OmpR family regulator
MDVVRRARPALVLLEHDLPDGPADDLLRSLGDDPATAAVPAVVLSADHDPLERVRLLRAGAAEVIGVPLDVRTLLDVVGAHLGPADPDLSDTGH